MSSSERLNLTLNAELWADVDKFRLLDYQSRQEFVKSAVSKYVSFVREKERADTPEIKRMKNENELLKSQIENLRKDFKSVTGKEPKIRSR